VSGGSYFLDFSEFNRNLKRLTEEEFPEYIGKGLFRAMNELLTDSITKPPQAPKDIGDLWGSRTGVMQGTELVVEKTRDAMLIKGGFHIKYAEKHHEAEPGTYKYTLTKGASQPGPKFMQSKMAQYANKYIETVANTIRNKGK